MCWCIVTGIRISLVASTRLIVQGLLVSIGVGSWALSLEFYVWCIKIVSILFICIFSYITTHGFLFFNGHHFAQGIHQICISLQRCNDFYLINLYLNWSFLTA